METLELQDGRLITYDVYGDPGGKPVIFNHGMSDSRLIRNPDLSLTESLGVRIVAADQPGVGGSTRQRGRRVVDWGADMEALVDALGLERFAVAGHSAGSPHALAVVYRMPDRVDGIVLASPLAPLDDKDMAKLFVNKELRLTARLHHLHNIIRVASDAAAKKALKDMPSFVEATAQDDPSDADTYLKDPAQRQMFEESFKAGMAQGGEGMYEEILSWWDWGFEPEDIQQHVELFYGDADDILDPRMPLHLAERLPDCATHVWEGAGHYGFVDRDRWVQFLRAVA